ncbi:ABC transporter ATP-binding protein [Geomonas anaerohicana]|uniref:ABC transporter ATP-binding protein n=1 Tax=Geomonas anaerohicana TaxID=2798583 RepID=A0ABS0YHP1_9BACT|nr:ABC transporter ATP-binding protein [Geomonas anaerohicana]MBJ6751444.1 ABC transporter ATP-binding protein [Geomonas anaerohicana]
MYALEIRGLGKTFRGKKLRTVEALKGIDLCVEQGEVLGFLGPNGAGKSTTIKCLMGLIRPTVGSATILGRDIASAEARTSVGYLPENPAFYDYLSAEEYLLFVGRAFGMQGDLLSRRCEEVLKQLELWEPRRRLIRTYSKGMVQRVGLAQVLLHDPEVYILDEPMSGLDPIGRALVKEIVLDLKRRGKCVFFSTHITDDVEKVCDRVAVINHGELKVVDRVENILMRGTEGYAVSIAAADGSVEERVVAEAQLQGVISDAVAAGRSILKVEPRRKSMEAFFLDIVGH